MLDGLAGFADDHIRYQMAMTVPVVALKTQQTAALFHCKGFGFGQRVGCLRGFHMRVEDWHHALGMTGPDSVAAGFRGAETLQMDVADAHLVQAGGKLALREAGFPGRRHGSHVDQQTDIGVFQRGQHAVDRTALVSDGQ